MSGDGSATTPHRILLVPGSTRSGSTNVAALRAMQSAARDRVTALVFTGLAELPIFNPDRDRDPLPQAVTALRGQIAAADGVLFAAPEYAGALPGGFKNLLDWTVGGAEMDGKPVAWINVAGEGRGLRAQLSLETVLEYLGATVLEPAGRRIFVPRSVVGADGQVHDDGVRAEIADALDFFARELAVGHPAVSAALVQ